MRKKIRPMGRIMLDLEPYLFELFIDHEMQMQEVFAQFLAWAEVHCEGAIPEYLDGTKPKLVRTNYGPKRRKRG